LEGLLEVVSFVKNVALPDDLGEVQTDKLPSRDDGVRASIHEPLTAGSSSVSAELPNQSKPRVA
jgi:hypothetical protein